jgi:hypothetical protein
MNLRHSGLESCRVALPDPRRAPGTELLRNFSSIHRSTAGDPSQTRNAWTVRWIFKSY